MPYIILPARKDGLQSRLSKGRSLLPHGNAFTLSSNIVRLVSVSLGHFANDFYMNLVPPILFVFADNMSLSLTEQGFLAFIITSSGSFAQPLIGHLCDKKGKPQFLVYSLVWIAFWMSITGHISNYYLLVVILGIGALASALYHPLGSAVTIRLINKAQGTSLSIFMAIGDFAASFAPLVVIPLVNNYGLQSLIYLLVPGLIVALFMYLTHLNKIEFNIGECSDEVQGKAEVKINMYTAKWLSILLFISTIRYWITRVFLVFGVQFLLLKDVNLNIAGIVLSLYLFAKTLGIFLGGIITDIIGSKNIMVISYLVSILCVGLMVLCSGLATIILFIVMGFAISTSSTANIVIAHQIVPKNATFATGLIMGFAGGLGGLGILLLGKLADMFGLLNAVTYLLVPLIITCIITSFLPATAGKKRLFKGVST
jgi:FSR family fosmidomycin resistance protein-like MFS transporter